MELSKEELELVKEKREEIAQLKANHLKRHFKMYIFYMVKWIKKK